MIYYFCRINSKFDRERFGDGIHVGPAYQKILNIASAISSVDLDIGVVTVPVCNELGLIKSNLRWIDGVVNGVRFFSLGTVCNVVLTRFFALFSFLFFGFRNLSRKDFVILYNFFPEYIFLAIYARLLGCKVILDVEDAPRDDEMGGRGIVNKISYALLSRICHNSCLTVSHKVANSLRLENYHVLYGALSPSVSCAAGKSKFESYASLNDGVIRFIYGGALLKETGIDLFKKAIILLSQHPVSPMNNIEIYITGHGDVDFFTPSAVGDLPDWLKIHDCRGLLYEDYIEVLNKCHVGLCLKIPGTSMADTTFPSKVVEILAAGLLLISTSVSDVPSIFNADEAIVLPVNDELHLTQAIFDVANDPEAYIQVSNKGVVRAVELFSYSTVGLGVKKWLSTL